VTLSGIGKGFLSHHLPIGVANNPVRPSIKGFAVRASGWLLAGTICFVRMKLLQSSLVLLWGERTRDVVCLLGIRAQCEFADRALVV